MTIIYEFYGGIYNMSVIISGSNVNANLTKEQLKPKQLHNADACNNIEMTLSFPLNKWGNIDCGDDGEFFQYVKTTVDRTNEKLKVMRTRCELSYYEDIKRISIKIINEDTKEVIREIPPEKTLQAVRNMMELAGLLVDERC